MILFIFSLSCLRFAPLSADWSPPPLKLHARRLRLSDESLRGSTLSLLLPRLFSYGFLFCLECRHYFSALILSRSREHIKDAGIDILFDAGLRHRALIIRPPPRDESFRWKPRARPMSFGLG